MAKFSPFPLLPFLIPPKKYSKAFRKENFESKKKVQTWGVKELLAEKIITKPGKGISKGKKPFDETTNKKKMAVSIVSFPKSIG